MKNSLSNIKLNLSNKGKESFRMPNRSGHFEVVEIAYVIAVDTWYISHLTYIELGPMTNGQTLHGLRPKNRQEAIDMAAAYIDSVSV